MKLSVVIITLILITGHTGYGQVEHNFDVDPENTDCHNLPKHYESLDQAIEIIQKATYRIQESFNISRYYSPRKLLYYSCDGDDGILIAYEDDEVFKIYLKIPTSVWKTFSSTNDPIEFYKEFKQQFKPLKP